MAPSPPQELQAAPSDAGTHCPFDASHLLSASMINPGADVDLFWCHEWPDSVRAEHSPSAVERFGIANTSTSATSPPCADPREVKDHARSPNRGKPEMSRAGHGWHTPLPGPGPPIQRLENDAHTKPGASSDDSSEAGTRAWATIQTRPLTAPMEQCKGGQSLSSRGRVEGPPGGRPSQASKSGTCPPRRCESRAFQRVITNRTGLRMMYVPQDMCRRLCLDDLFPIRPDGRRSKSCMIDLTLPSGAACPVTLIKTTSRGHSHRRFTTGWREFCNVAGVQVGDRLKFVRGRQSNVFIVEVV